ncbi:LCP family protein [Oceanobacillus salinisoli]|uniref:LCP family protein n=1 Tax=Oceanobacillus salinisoli TaxID=2678611 RepID=UPI0012E193EC|nr:LCP family protein [Oceanobacillus salinisoli]
MTKSNKKDSRLDKRKVGKNKRKLFFFIGIPLFVLLLTALFYGNHLYKTAEKLVESSFEEIERENGSDVSELREEPINPVADNVSILIIGVDDSEERNYNEHSRSDALILATFNKEEGDVKLLSIPRDSYVFVPEVGDYTKINHAHFFGGAKATVETVENFLNVPVDYYVKLNFDAFIEVVDSLGGIMYNVPFEMYELDSDDNRNAIHLTPGYKNLSGEEALAVARSRKYDSDIERGKRQQEIIKAVVKQSASVSSITKLDNVITAVGDNMTTNLTFDEMKSFLSYGLKKDINITSLHLEGEGGKLEDGLWYYQVNEESRATVEDELRQHLDLSIQNSNHSKLSQADDKSVNMY